MKKRKLFNKEFSKKDKTAITSSVILLYFIFAVFLVILSNYAYKDTKIFNFDIFSLRGVITQLQLILSVYILLVLDRKGFIISIILNTLSILLASLHIITQKSSISLPGLTSSLTTIFLLILLNLYKNQSTDLLLKLKKKNSDLLDSEQKLYKQAYYDLLTKLPNRFHYIIQLDKEIKLAYESNNILAVVYIDLDSFKTVNDTLGHYAGDQVLIEVANRFSQILAEECLIARSGGDEFILLIKNFISKDKLIEILDKLILVFYKPIIVEGISFYISASAGVSLYPFDGDDSTELIKNADISMYEAKFKGKNQYVFCDDAMKKNIKRKVLLTNALYLALDNNELFIEYQPQVSSKTTNIVGLEALLRWNSREYGLIPPKDFIPLAEQTGIIKSIGLWVFKKVCEDFNYYSFLYDKEITISINFSLEQLKDKNIINDLKNIINEVKIEAKNIVVEVTESIAFSKEINILDKLLQLKEMGFSIAIDDFGKEYSSLNRILYFPVDIIKIDMDFIHGISTGDERDRTIISTIIHLAKTLGHTVLAEGVETKEQYEFLKYEECDEVQGFLFYKPMKKEKIKEILEKNTH